MIDLSKINGGFLGPDYIPMEERNKDEMITDLQNEIKIKNKEIERLNNIINELEKYIGQEWYCFDNESIEFEVARNILIKLKELKESGNK